MKQLDIFDAINLKKLIKLEEYDIAKIISNLPLEKQLKIIHLLPANKRALVLTHLEVKNAYQIIISLNKTLAKTMLGDLETDDLANIVENLEEEEQQEILGLLKGKKKEQIKYLLLYQENSAASMMAYEYLTISNDVSVHLALKDIINRMNENDYIDTIFYVDEDKTLIGTIYLKELITTNPNLMVSELVNKNYIWVAETDSTSLVIDKVSDYDLLVIPVLNEQHQLTGIISADDILSEIKETYEDTARAITNAHLDDEDKKVLPRVISRLPWLIVSIICNLLIALLISRFEDTINSIWALAFFQPMILGMAGNIGNQGIATTILGLSSGILTKKPERKKHINKELLISLINSLIIGIVGCGFAIGCLFILKVDNNDFFNIKLGVVVGLSLFISMFVSGSSATLLPLGFYRIKIDPISASGPTISTINDIFALISYIVIATIIIL
ncbi:MAG: magnesium transporter [Acholeplasmatales bacterium]|jgi:magnesium transporter|nr:magnesium transporter [Acholeplasmatales bacterium]